MAACQSEAYLNPSQTYRDAVEDCRRHHMESKTFSGKLALPHAVPIKELILRHGVADLLDYGCGKGSQYRDPHPDLGVNLEEFWGVPVAKYDPAWPPFEAEPVGSFDMVICTHALGSIPRPDLPWALNRVFGFARKVVYVGEIIGGQKKKVLRTAEPSLSRDQWIGLLRNAWDGHRHLAVRFSARADHMEMVVDIP